MTQPENLNAVDCIHQNLLTKRLDQDRPRVALQHMRTRGLLFVRRDKDNRDLRMVGNQLALELDTTLPRRAHIE